jgi:hypothetical protein
MLAAFYLLLRAVDQGSRILAILAIFCEYMSLWTYESPIVIILLAPLLLVWLRGDVVRKCWAAIVGWYAVPVVYLIVTAVRYLRSSGLTYQESVLRKDWSFAPMLQDWLFNIGASLRFWAWPREQPARAPDTQLALLAALAVVLLIGGIIALRASRIPEMRKLFGALAAGLLLIVFSFPAYLLLNSARSLWRTQMLSSIGAALFLGALIVICASALQAKWLRFGLLAVLSACVVWCGSYSALAKSANHRWLWDRHERAMQEVLDVAPRLKSGTLIILTNVPEGERDPLGGDNMWFDMALRLAYPGTPVAGAYWHHDGTPARGVRPRVDPSGRWSLRGNPLVQQGGADSILAMQYSEDGRASASPVLPKFLGFGERASGLYNPTARIEHGPPAQPAVRRYGLPTR